MCVRGSSWIWNILTMSTGTKAKGYTVVCMDSYASSSGRGSVASDRLVDRGGLLPGIFPHKAI